jgi:hypothetical protein
MDGEDEVGTREVLGGVVGTDEFALRVAEVKVVADPKDESRERSMHSLSKRGWSEETEKKI